MSKSRPVRGYIYSVKSLAIGGRDLSPGKRRRIDGDFDERRIDGCELRGERCAIHGGHKSCQLEATAGSHNFGDRAHIYIGAHVRGRGRDCRGQVKEHEPTNVSKGRRRPRDTR